MMDLSSWNCSRTCQSGKLRSERFPARRINYRRERSGGREGRRLHAVRRYGRLTVI